MTDLDAVTTARLLVRPPRETDRSRFIELFCDEDFMVFYPSVLTQEQASDHFDRMLAVCQTIPFWKQAPVDGDLRNLYTLSVSPTVSPPASSAS